MSQGIIVAWASQYRARYCQVCGRDRTSMPPADDFDAQSRWRAFLLGKGPRTCVSFILCPTCMEEFREKLMEALYW